MIILFFKASSVNNFGVAVGEFISYNVFVLLYDPGWCQRIFNSNDKILNPSSLFFYCFLSCPIITILLLFKKELEIQDQNKLDFNYLLQ